MNPEQHWFMWRLAIQLQEQGPPETWHLSIVSGPPELFGGLQRAGLLIKPKRLSKAGVDSIGPHNTPRPSVAVSSSPIRFSPISLMRPNN